MLFIKKKKKINMQAFRIHVTLKEATSWPIAFFMKEQNTGSSLSFSVPTQPEGYVKLPISLFIIIVNYVGKPRSAI